MEAVSTSIFIKSLALVVGNSIYMCTQYVGTCPSIASEQVSCKYVNNCA